MPLSALLAVARRATPGPWTVSEYVDPGDGLAIRMTMGGVSMDPVRVSRPGSYSASGSYCVSSEERDALAAHIAAFSPSTCIALVERLREAEELLRRTYGWSEIEGSSLARDRDAWLARAENDHAHGGARPGE
jgi:hypothetical protein